MPLLRVPPAVPADSVRRAVREVFARPEYQWTPGTRSAHWLRDLWLRFIEWLNRFTAHHPTGAKLLFWGALAILIGLLVHLGVTVWRIYRVTVDRPPPGSPGTLPALLDGPTHLARAEAMARAGRYTEALAHRFAALLFDLDRADALTFHPSKTPAEYVREARLPTEDRNTLAGLVARLYHHVFGAEPCDEQCYRDFGILAGTVARHVAPH